MLTSACSLLLFIELRERGLLRGYGFDLLKLWEERGEFSIIYQEITRCHHFESMILVSLLFGIQLNYRKLMNLTPISKLFFMFTNKNVAVG